MLAKIREKTQGIIATLILGFLAIPFVLWGIGSYFEGNTVVPVAEVNGIEISQQAYRQRLEQLAGFDPSRAESRMMKQMILESLIEQTLLVSEAEDRGYRLSDTKLREIIHSIPQFQQNGSFDPGLYEALLRQQRMRPSDFEARLRHDSVAMQVQQGLAESAFVTDADMAAMVRLLKQERRFSYAVVSADAFMNKVTVDPKEIEEYYQANQESFRSPEAVQVEYLTLKVTDASRQIQPTDEELRQAYNADQARYVTPEKRKISHILLNVPAGADEKAVQARAESLAKQLRGGANFAALAKKHSDDKESAAKGGDLGDLIPGTLPAELEAAGKALKAGEISAPIRTTYGFHVLKLTALQPEQRRSFEQARPELLEQVRRAKGEERFYELAERFRNLVYENPESLQPAAKELGLTVQTSDWFTRGRGPGIAAQPRVVAAAFEPEVLSKTRNSDVIELNAETLVALRVVDHKPSVVRPLEEVRLVIERTLKDKHAREQAQAVAQEWVKKLEQGAKLNELARAGGATLQAGKSITREQTAGTDKRLVDAVFAAPRPKDQAVVGQVDLGRQGYAVYALEAVRDADAATVDAALKEKVRNQLVQRRGADYYASYRTGLRKSADVKINNDQL